MPHASLRNRQRPAAAQIGVALFVLLSGPSCSSPTAPAGEFSISGNTLLPDVGQTAQLTARDASGGDVTLRATWHSADATIAVVSTAGLVTATGLGSTNVSAVYQQSTAAVTVVVGPQPPRTLSSCGAIVSPGRYLLSTDLPLGAVTAPCISIANTANVSLDCAGHSPGEVKLSNLSSASLTNCTFDEVVGNGLSDIMVTASTIRTWSSSGQQERVTLKGNHITGNGVSMAGAQSAAIMSNNFDNFASSAFYAVYLAGGADNEVSGNTIDGGYDGQPNNDGLDDGVILINETGDQVENNTIRNCYDTAVEGLGTLTSTTISANVGVNIGIAGIGAYWCTHWTANTVSGNDISRSPALLHIEYLTGPRCVAPQPQAGFSDNQIVNNRFRDPAPGVQSIGSAPRMYIAFTASAGASANLIAGNDFGAEPGPQLSPLSGFVDGGNNVCASLSSSSQANFPCGSFAVSPSTMSQRHH